MKRTIIIVRMNEAGKLSPKRSNGALKASAGRRMGDDAEVRAAAQADPDNPPLTRKRMASMRRVPQMKVLRRALGLQPTRAYLRVIAREPEAAFRALQPI